MKFTWEVRDAIQRRAKAQAAKSGMTLSQFVTEALEDHLKRPDPKPKNNARKGGSGKFC